MTVEVAFVVFSVCLVFFVCFFREIAYFTAISLNLNTPGEIAVHISTTSA